MGKIDVGYCSFSPSRAGQQWKIFFENLSVLRKRHASWTKHDQDIKARNAEIDELDQYFLKIINEHRESLLNFLQDKTDYLINQYKQGGHSFSGSKSDIQDYKDFSGKGVLHLILTELGTDSPKLKAAYEKDVIAYTEYLEKINKIYIIHPPEDESVILTEQQKDLNNNSSLRYFFRGSNFKDTELVEELMRLDQNYGGFLETEDSDIFDPDEDIMILALVEAYNLKTEDCIPLKSEWIRLFLSLTSEKITEAAKIAMKDPIYEDLNQEDAEWSVRDYLRAIRPIIKDLKENDDAIFFRYYGGDSTPQPSSSKKILWNRAEEHARQFKLIVESEKKAS